MQRIKRSMLIQEKGVRTRSLFLLHPLHLNTGLQECSLQRGLNIIRTAMNRSRSRLIALNPEYTATVMSN